MESSKTTTREITTLPLIALIGPTNAGKSTLFNRLTNSYQAVTAADEATTRDRIFGEGSWRGVVFNLVDTGGLTGKPKSELDKSIRQQMEEAIQEADRIIFIYDGRIGLTERDQRFLSSWRGEKTIILAANKIDSEVREVKTADLGYLGFPFFPISALSGRGVGDLLDRLTEGLPRLEQHSQVKPIVALVGRPNVGKSSLLNALSQTNRAIVSEVPGTTRDIVTAELKLGDQTLILADTAGVRRRGKMQVGPEKFSVKRALAAIQASQAVLVLVDASEGTTRGDLHLIYFAEGLNKPVLLVFNKLDKVTDGLIPYHPFLKKFPSVEISALKRQGLEKIVEWIKEKIG